MYALDVRELLQWLQTYHHHDSSTVRVSDDATRSLQSILSITLRHYQRHILVHAEGAGVVNHDSTILCDVLAEFL